MLNIGGCVISVTLGWPPFWHLYVGDTVLLLVMARSHMQLFNLVHSRDLLFHVACTFLGELVMPCLWQRLACF